MREVIEHLRERVFELSAEEDYGPDGETVISGDGYAFAQAADALELLEKLRGHPGAKAFASWLRTFWFESKRAREVQELVLQLLNGGE